MGLKYLLDRDKVYESWLNPILNGGTNQGSNIQAPGTFNPVGPYQSPADFTSVQQQPCADMIEKPFWLNNDDESLVMNGDTLSIGSYFLNGVPLSSWSANFGSGAAFSAKQTMQNWYYLDALTQHLFPDGIKAYINKREVLEYNITDLTIIKMVPHSNAIGLNLYIKFTLNEEEIWGKFENIGTAMNLKPVFICEEILRFNQETQIKVIGKLWNMLANWFKIKSGIYKCVIKELLVYSELGQLKKLSDGNIIEVLNSDDTKIKIKYDNTTYFIKKPTYYWFNWYFVKN